MELILCETCCKVWDIDYGYKKYTVSWAECCSLCDYKPIQPNPKLTFAYVNSSELKLKSLRDETKKRKLDKTIQI